MYRSERDWDTIGNMLTIYVKCIMGGVGGTTTNDNVKTKRNQTKRKQNTMHAI